jgi:signal transduction histidine kinase
VLPAPKKASDNHSLATLSSFSAVTPVEASTVWREIIVTNKVVYTCTTPDEIFNPLVCLYSRRAVEKGLDFRYISHGLPPSIKNAKSIQEILMPLLDNAVNFTEQGEIVLSVEGCAKRIIFKVTDTGRGISESDAKFLFRFSGKSRGLFITHHLVDSMKGIVAVNSIIGIGSTFTVEIPLCGRSL